MDIEEERGGGTDEVSSKLDKDEVRGGEEMTEATDGDNIFVVV